MLRKSTLSLTFLLVSVSAFASNLDGKYRQGSDNYGSSETTELNITGDVGHLAFTVQEDKSTSTKCFISFDFTISRDPKNVHPFALYMIVPSEATLKQSETVKNYCKKKSGSPLTWFKGADYFHRRWLATFHDRFSTGH